MGIGNIHKRDFSKRNEYLGTEMIVQSTHGEIICLIIELPSNIIQTFHQYMFLGPEI